MTDSLDMIYYLLVGAIIFIILRELFSCERFENDDKKKVAYKSRDPTKLNCQRSSYQQKVNDTITDYIWTTPKSLR